jgi:hypothetical protein
MTGRPTCHSSADTHTAAALVAQVLGCCMLPLARLKDATPPKVYERMTEKRASALAEQQQQQQQARGASAQAGKRGGDVGHDQQDVGDLCWALVQEFLEVGHWLRSCWFRSSWFRSFWRRMLSLGGA